MKYTNYSLSKNTYIKARIGWQGLTTAEYLETGNYYLVTGTDIKNGYINFSDCVFVSQNRYSQDVHIQLRLDDVLISKDGTIGKVAYINNLPLPATLNSGVFLIRVDNNVLTQKYFYYLLQSTLFKSFINQTSAGSTITHLYQKDIVKFSFDIPKVIGMQHHIVNIMESVDNMIHSLKMNRDKINNMFYGALSKHFCSDKVKPCLVEEIMMLKKGKQFNGDKLTTDGIYKMYNGGTSYSGLLNDWNIQKNTIIISEGGNSCGYVNYIRENFWAGGHCYYAIPNKKYNKKYLYYALKYSQDKIMKLRVGSGLPNIQKKSLYKFEIMMSNDKDIQDDYQLKFDSFENKINSLDLKIKKYEDIREGLLNGLFTGKIDVPENYEEV